MEYPAAPDRDILCVVTGLPHSGTTYLSKVLASNPDIMTGFECGILLDDLARYPKVLPWYTWMQESADRGQWGITPEHMAEICAADSHIAAYGLIKKYAGEIGAPQVRHCFSDAKYLIDKTPEYIFKLDRVMGRVQLPFVVIEKEITSQHGSYKRRGLSTLWFVYDYLRAAHGLRMAQKKYGSRILVVHHRELVANREKVLKTVYDFLGLPYYPKSSLEEFFRKTGFNPGGVQRSKVGLRTKLQQKDDSMRLRGSEIGLLKMLQFLRRYLPSLVSLSARTLTTVRSAKKRLSS